MIGIARFTQILWLGMSASFISFDAFASNLCTQKMSMLFSQRSESQWDQWVGAYSELMVGLSTETLENILMTRDPFLKNINVALEYLSIKRAFQQIRSEVENSSNQGGDLQSILFAKVESLLDQRLGAMRSEGKISKIISGRIQPIHIVEMSDDHFVSQAVANQRGTKFIIQERSERLPRNWPLIKPRIFKWSERSGLEEEEAFSDKDFDGYLQKLTYNSTLDHFIAVFSVDNWHSRSRWKIVRFDGIGVGSLKNVIETPVAKSFEVDSDGNLLGFGSHSPTRKLMGPKNMLERIEEFVGFRKENYPSSVVAAAYGDWPGQWGMMSVERKPIPPMGEVVTETFYVTDIRGVKDYTWRSDLGGQGQGKVKIIAAKKVRAFAVMRYGGREPEHFPFDDITVFLPPGIVGRNEWSHFTIQNEDAPDGYYDWNVAQLSPDGKYLILGSMAGDVFIFDSATRTLIDRFRAHDGKIIVIELSGDQRKVFTIGEDYRLKIWNFDSWVAHAR